MIETLVSELVAIIRRTPGDAAPLLRARLPRELAAPDAATLGELVRRARAFDSSDEEIALSLGALLATPRPSEKMP
jgi:hypothetical protein